jgi:hypothetical protein
MPLAILFRSPKLASVASPIGALPPVTYRHSDPGRDCIEVKLIMPETGYIKE